MPTDITQFTTATAATVLAVAGLVSLLKPYLEAWWLPPAAALHDNTVRVCALATGIVIVAVATLVAPHSSVTGPLLFGAVVEGIKSGAGAIVTYHVVTSSIFGALTAQSSQIAPAAPTVLLPASAAQSAPAAPIAPPAQPGSQSGNI